MGKKYYAVRAGKTPGIYRTWDDCRKQVYGFKGAKYKGFETLKDAENFMEAEESNIKLVEEDIPSIMASNDVEAVAYVDGSYDNANKKYSFGAVIFYKEKEIQLSGAGEEPGMVEMRNVAGEIKSAMKSVEYCVDNNISSIMIFHDYQGIGKWGDGVWKTNLPETTAYKEYMKNAREKDGMKILFKHVKGHSGNKYNELADKLAKEALSQ
ncbi:MAG: ribonuclease H family protein [Peptostreptococcaceae bacterium]|nr:ribonuclease H family protein [Peptostreptococcaceae bacterium]